MDKELLNSTRKERPRLFPSTELVVLLYSLGALVGLCFAFSGDLGALQTTNCLLLSWVLALGALAMSVLGEPNEDCSDDIDELY